MAEILTRETTEKKGEVILRVQTTEDEEAAVRWLVETYHHNPPPNEKDKQILFALGSSDDGPVLTFAIPEKAWEAIRNGTTSEFDLTQVGVPLRVMIFGCRNYQTAKDMLTLSASMAGIPLKNVSDVDLRFRPKHE